MVTVSYDAAFKRRFQRIKDAATKERVRKHIRKIVEHPEIGKPMMYARRGTLEVHVSPFRISYGYIDNKVIFLDLYHKDEQ